MTPELAVVFPRAAVTGGVERMALEVVRDQMTRRSTVFVGTELDAPFPVRHRPVPLPRVPGPLRPLAFRRRAARVLAADRPVTTLSFGVECPPGDVYWVQSVHAAWLEQGGQVYLRGRQVSPALRRLKPVHRVLLGLERDYFTRPAARLILCTSAREVDDLERIYGVDRTLMRVLPNCYDAAVFNPQRSASLRAAVRAEIGATADEIVVLMIANEWHRKGLATVLRAVSAVADPRVRVDLVGARPPVAYDQMAADLHVEHRLTWHGRSNDVARYLAAADVFALPTAYEPFGLVIVEAMACGVPTITSTSAGAAQAIDDGTSGLLLGEPSDVDAMAGALTALLDDATRARIGPAGSAAVTRFERRPVLDEFDRLVFGR